MKITDKIHLLQIDFEIALSPERKIPRFVNVILLFGETITLIDSGVKGSEAAIFDYLAESGREPSEIKTLILSHSHPDHIGSTAKIKELTNCKVLAHKAEREWIENIELQNKQRPIPGFFNLVDQSVPIDEPLNGTESLSLDNDLTIELIHSPGHSKGSLNVFFREDKVLFTADSIPLKNDIPNYDNYNDLMNSLEAIKSRNDYHTLLTSWTPALNDRSEIGLLIEEGENYLKKIDSVVKASYTSESDNDLEYCKSVIEELRLPPFLVNPIVDRAFRSHLSAGTTL